jgi:CheY-like chemotaxis protein
LALFCLKRGKTVLMLQNGPIIVVEDDLDDQEIFRDIFSELKVKNLIRFFNSCRKALDYLLTTIEKPFLILSDINLPAMTGLQMREEIMENDELKKKFIPFIFFSTNIDQKIISLGYELCVQGYFVKPTTLNDLKEVLKTILDYWKACCWPCPDLTTCAE